ncbi:MAG TPA: hypothetical protein PKI61_03575 [bacterium]|nr:hypothetical protein [bacterium]HPT29796.1 hypothetical protein [bacterium]
MIFSKKQPASALLVTILILGGVFIIAFGASYLVFFNTKGNDADSQSIKAYYAALGGTEKLRYDRRKAGLDIEGCTASLLTGTLNNSSTYQIDCNSTAFTPGKIISRGFLFGLERQINSGYCFDINVDCTTTCAIGSICGGGTLISHNPNLVVAPSNNAADGCVGGATCATLDSTLAAYAATSTVTSATSVTDGRDNITAIIAAAGSLDDYPAPRACDALDIIGFSDWYLPAKDELNLILRNSNLCAGNTSGPEPRECLNGSGTSHPNVNGFFNGFDRYWTSTEASETTAWGQVFPDGTQDDQPDKGTDSGFRCIRRF